MVGTRAAVSSTTWPGPTPVPARAMRAVVFEEFGGPDVLHVSDLPVPEVGRDDILVRVAAVSIGRLLDLNARAGTHPFADFRFPHVLGAEHAGTVVQVGADVVSPVVGDHVAVFPVVTCGVCVDCRAGKSEACSDLRIIGVHQPGAYAEYAVSPAGNSHVVPEGISPVDAAALALAGPVAQNQLLAASLDAGDWVLVQGGGSSLGSLTASLAAHHGARVIATSRSAGKREKLRELGVEVALDPTAPDFVDTVMRRSGGRGVRVAIDDLGEPEIWNRTMEVLASRGTVVSSGAFLGKGGVRLDLMRLYLRSQRIVGVRTGNEVSTEILWRQVGRGFRPIVDTTFPAAHAGEAHRYMESDQNMGRVVLTTSTDEDWST